MKIKKTAIAIIGAGTIGQGIAEVVARAGMEVYLKEKYPELLDKGMRAITAELDQEIAKWGLTEGEKKSILSRIHPVGDDEVLRDCAFIIEAIQENIADKAKLFAKLDRIAGPETVFITNTALLSITEIASHTQRADKVMGMCFLHPVSRIKVVELIRGLQTSAATFAQVKKLAAHLGKTPVEVFEYPGFITTRIIIPFINEAMYVLMEGVATAEDIDTAMSLGFRMEVGPLHIADRISLDVVMTWMETLFRELGDSRYRPCPLLRKMVRAGHLGRKSGRGFFEYDADGREVKRPPTTGRP